MSLNVMGAREMILSASKQRKKNQLLGNKTKQNKNNNNDE